MRPLLLALLPALALAAVDGTVVNQTTGKPQAGAVIQLYQLTQAGPKFLANVKSDASGHFQFDRALEPGPHLIETSYSGVNYTTVLPPGSPSTGLNLAVYDMTNNAGAVQLAQHIVFLEPAGEQLAVTETFFFTAAGKLTYFDPQNGTVRFFVPPAAKSSVRVMATAPGSMAVQREPDPGKSEGTFKLNFPIKPGGETRIDVAYSLPYSDPATFAGRVLYKGTSTRLAVPNGVTLEGKDLKSLGQEPQTQAMLYETPSPSFELKISGRGSLRAAAGGDAEEADDSGPTIRAIPPPGFEDRKFEILGLSLAVLALGFVLLYRRGSQPEPARTKSRG